MPFRTKYPWTPPHYGSLHENDYAILDRSLVKPKFNEPISLPKPISALHLIKRSKYKYLGYVQTPFLSSTTIFFRQAALNNHQTGWSSQLFTSYFSQPTFYPSHLLSETNTSKNFKVNDYNNQDLLNMRNTHIEICQA